MQEGKPHLAVIMTMKEVLDILGKMLGYNLSSFSGGVEKFIFELQRKVSDYANENNR